MAGSTFAELLRQHRLSRGLTQAELAERSGLSGRAISDLERGLKQAPRSSTVRLLVRGLGLAEAEAAVFLRTAQSGRDPIPEGGLGRATHNLPLPTTSFTWWVVTILNDPAPPVMVCWLALGPSLKL